MEQELALLVEAVRKAGAKVRELVRDGFEVQTKPDRSPVTTVDHEVNRILYEMQRREFPQDGWLSEESPDDPARLTHQRVWIVDPIDGTKALINRLPEFTISAALIERGIPIVGAILNPSTDELFTAVRGGGLYLNGSRVTLAPPRDFNAVIMISGKDFGTDRWSTLGDTTRCRPIYSIANAMALVAAGRVRAAFTVEPMNEWDLAAGVLLTPASLATLRGKTVIQMGTIAQEESLILQAEIEQVGGSYCEAPVLGSLTEAKAGTLFVMVGGTEDQFAQWLPLFRALSREPRLVGPVGKAAAMKLALNQLIAAEISAFALSLGLVQRAGIPVDTFMAILRESALFAPTFEKKLPRLLSRDYQHPNFSTRHLMKDVELFLKEAAGYGLITSSAEGIRPLLEQTIALGLGEADYASIYETVNPKT